MVPLFPQAIHESQTLGHSGHPQGDDVNGLHQTSTNYMPSAQMQHPSRYYNGNLSYADDVRARQTQPVYGQDQYRRSLTPVGQNSYQDYTNSFSIQRPMNSMNYSFGGAPYNDYGRHDMSRSVQNISTIGGPLSMTSAPFGAHPSLPYPTAMPYNSVAGYQPQNAAFQEWMMNCIKVELYNDKIYVRNKRMAALRQQESGERQRLTPHRFPHRHSRVCFGSTNQLIVISGNNVNIQQLDPSLIDVNETVFVSTWPGPLVKGETEKADVLEYIRTQEGSLKNSEHLPEDYVKHHQKKQIWLLLSMLVRQNGLISGADLSELLLSNNDSEFEFTDEGTEIAKLRRYLLLGQKKTALEFATKSNLWGHAFALTHLTTKEVVAGQMNGMVSKFVNSTLDREDPLYVLFRCLLQRQQDKAGNKLVPTANLQQFAILLANDCDVSPIISNSSQSAELLKFIVALRNNSSQLLVNLSNLDNTDYDEKGNKVINYSDELVFVNEIWEFSRNINEFIEVMVPLKLIFAARLFDYGFINQATRYCYVIRQYHTYYSYYFQGKTIEQSSINWDVILSIVNDMECRLFGFDVTGGKGDKVTTDKEPSSTTGNNKDSEDEDEDEDEDGEEEKEDLVVEKDDVDSRPVQKNAAVDLNKREDVLQKPKDQKLSFPSQGRTSRGQSESNGGHITKPVNQLPSLPLSVAPANNTNVHSQKARTRTQTEESSKLETQPPTPAESSANAVTFLPQTFVNHSQQPIESLTNSKPTLFVPPVPSTADTSDFNFVSTYTPAFTQGNSGLVSNDHSPDDDGVVDTSNDYPSDGRYSAPPRDEPGQPWNSTAMPAYNNGTKNEFGAPFSPINSPEPEQLSYSNQSNIRTNLSNGSNNASNTAANETESSKQSQQPKQKGWFGSIMEKVVPQGPKRAILPDDKNPTIYYDDNLKRWVNKDDPSDGGANDAVLNGPPKMPMPVQNAGLNAQPRMVAPVPSSLPSSGLGLASQAAPAFPPLAGQLPGANNYSFVRNARPKQRYVDVWQQSQQKAS